MLPPIRNTDVPTLYQQDVRARCNGRSLYFLGLSGLAFVTLGALGWTLSSVQDPGRYLNTCNESSLYSFRYLPAFLQQSVCSLYQGLQDFQAQPFAGGYLLVSQLVRVGPFLVTLLSYESFRQQTFWRRRGASFYLLLAQALSGAVSIPLYFATLCWGDQGAQLKRKQSAQVSGTSDRTSQAIASPQSVSSEQRWAVFASASLGYLLPLLYGTYSHWSNRAITVFLGFPIYVMTINTFLPSILLRVSRDLAYRSSRLPLLLCAAACLVTSFHGHLRLLLKRDGTPFTSIFWPSGPAGMTRDLHVLLLHDYTFVLVELFSFVLLYTYRLRSRKEKLKAMKLLLLISAAAGPTAALSIVWAMAELSDAPQGDDVIVKTPSTMDCSTSIPEVASERQPLLAADP